MTFTKKIIIMVLSISSAFTLNSLVLADAKEDATITAEVKSKLMEEKDIPQQHIEVTTKDGVVSLKVKVDTHLQANKAIEIASSVDKVVDVIESGLKIKDSKSLIENIIDSAITAKVKGKIKHLSIYEKIAEGYDLHVETKDHVVHIHGSVKREMDIDTVVTAAKGVKGVKEVTSNITLK